MARILLLEDDLDLAELLGMALEADGHQVQSTASGKEALLLAAQSHRELLILDLEVRELSGFAVARAVSDFHDSPTLVVSARGGDWQREAFRSGAWACLPKPFELNDLRAIVSTLLQQPHPVHEEQVAKLSAEDLARVRGLTPEQLDALPFGVIQVDQHGVIVGFNQYESAAAGRTPTQVIGRPFAEVAPCSQVKDFAGAIAEAQRTGTLDRVLRLVFPAGGALTVVSVRLFYEAPRKRTWIFVSRRLPRSEPSTVHFA